MIGYFRNFKAFIYYILSCLASLLSCYEPSIYYILSCLAGLLSCYEPSIYYILSCLAGLLSCYEPSINGMDVTNPSSYHLRELRNHYKQMLDSLLQDCAIQPNDWHHMSLAPKAWCHFMKKLYLVFIQVNFL